MRLDSWKNLPENMKNEHVRYYFEILQYKKFDLILKRIFDLVFSVILFIILVPVFIVISLSIIIDSSGPVFFRQTRVTQYGEKFKIFKFRTMVQNAEKMGSKVTIKNDLRITTVGKFIRKYRIDEVPQLFNIFLGDMTFVGTRPEVPKYVEQYSEEMMATLMLPAGVTSKASINFRNEAELLSVVEDIDKIYIKEILPNKMKYNLEYLQEFSIINDIKIIIDTIRIILKY